MGKNVDQSGDSGNEACVSPTTPDENIPEHISEELPLRSDASKSGNSPNLFTIFFT